MLQTKVDDGYRINEEFCRNKCAIFVTIFPEPTWGQIANQFSCKMF